MEKYNITFKGYRRDVNKRGLPSYGGIYMVYCCTFNEKDKTVTLRKLIYIGQAINIRDRICNHDKYNLFTEQLYDENEQLCYAYASVSQNDIDIVENGLIYMQKPDLNERMKDCFDYPDSEFHIDGSCALLKMKDFSITTENKDETN